MNLYGENPNSARLPAPGAYGGNLSPINPQSLSGAPGATPQQPENSAVYSPIRPQPDNIETGAYILAQNAFPMYFMRNTDHPPNEAILRLSSSVALSGCLKMTLPHIKKEDYDTFQLYTITNAAVGVKKGAQYAHFQCGTGMNFPTADIVLNRDELIKKKVKKIGFRTDKSATDYYMVDINMDRIALVGRKPEVFKPYTLSGRIDPLVHWFYPENTIVLFSPSAPPGVSLENEIKELAIKSGFIPLENVVKNFVPPSTKANTFYFIDEKGDHAGKLRRDEPEPFATVAAQKEFRGIQGMYLRPSAMDIYIRLPGSLE